MNTNTSDKTGFLYDARFLAHDTGALHPERKERLTRTLRHLEKQPWFPHLMPITPPKTEKSLEWVRQIHSNTYIERAEESCRKNQRILDTPDVAISPESFQIALLAAGSALELADRIMAGQVRNAFALLRPPGHHAEKDFAMGFCLFNNAAIAAKYLQKNHGLERILILDWDVHHGNGTQHLFEEDPTVLYVSLHQYPFYPGTGAAWETGTGKGAGATLNCPMKAGATDQDYENAFTSAIAPKADAFKPDAIVLSAGFDAHRQDPLGQINLSSGMFEWMTRRVMEWADKYARGRILSLLEGGYHLEALPDCVAKHVGALCS